MLTRKKKQETFHVTKTSPDNEAGDIVYDFKKVFNMITLFMRNILLHILQVILMSVDSGLFCAI